MQFRFLLYDDETNTNKLLGYSKIDTDYDVAYKMFYYMKEHECDFCVEMNIEGLVDTEGEYFVVRDVSYVFPKSGEELTPHVVVSLGEAY